MNPNLHTLRATLFCLAACLPACALPEKSDARYSRAEMDARASARGDARLDAAVAAAAERRAEMERSHAELETAHRAAAAARRAEVDARLAASTEALEAERETARLAAAAADARRRDEILRTATPATFGPPPPEDHAELERGVVLALLKDPESARITYTEPRTEVIPRPSESDAEAVWVTGLNVNARNSYGGYAGAQTWSFAWRDGKLVATKAPGFPAWVFHD